MNNKILGGKYSFVSQYYKLFYDKEIQDRLLGGEDIDDIWDAILYSSISHEQTHFIQNFTTSYGIFKTVNSRLAGMTIAAALKALMIRGRKIETPIDEMLSRSKPPEEDWEFFITTAKFILQTEDFFEHGGLVESHHLFRSVNQPIGSTSPVVTTPKTGSLRLTAGLLMEFQALAQQIETLDRFPSIQKSFADELFSELSSRFPFRRMWAMMSHAFGDPKATRGKNIAAYELCTLALNPMFPKDLIEGFNFLQPDSRNEHRLVWEDVHPGWRFYKIIDFLGKEKLPAPKTHQEVRSLLETICCHFEWDRPSHVVPETIKNIKQSSELFPELYMPLNKDFTLGTHINTVVSHDFLSFESARISMTDKIFSQFIRGPFPGRSVNPEAIAFDLALQMFYSKHFECPMCFEIKHHLDGCAAKDLQADFREIIKWN